MIDFFQQNIYRHQKNANLVYVTGQLQLSERHTSQKNRDKIGLQQSIIILR